MGNGSSKHGDARADQIRDEFAKNRALRQKARAQLDSIRDSDPDADDTQRLQAVLADSRAPAPARGLVVALSPFKSDWAKLGALVVLGVLVVALVVLGAAKMLGG